MAVDVVEPRAERFAREIGEMRIGDPAPGRHGLWLRVGGGLMALGLVCCVVAIVQSSGTDDPLVQRDALAIGQSGIAAAVVGTGIYLRYSVTKVLRFWFARFSFDLQQNADTRGADRTEVQR